MPSHFIVRHDLHSFRAMPGFIWRIGKRKNEIPRGFRQIQKRDRWIEFAYIKDEIDYESCSIITGFYECTKPHWYGRIPLDKHRLDAEYWGYRKAHMIKGKKHHGYQPHYPVTVPSIREMLGRDIQPQVTIARIELGDFARIRKVTDKCELNPSKIPLLKREPLNEQEVLSLVVGGHAKLGIDRILEVQTRFPDMLVSINGKKMYLELEVDSQGFQVHIDKRQLRRISKGRFKGSSRQEQKRGMIRQWRSSVGQTAIGTAV